MQEMFSLLALVVVVADQAGSGHVHAAAGTASRRGPVKKMEGWQAMRDILLGIEQPQEPSSNIEVIGAGLSKTGTKSMQFALETLGYVVYDSVPFMQNATHPQLLKQYAQATDEPSRQASFDRFYDAMVAFGATATLDTPLFNLVGQQLRRNPSAKVLLTVRPSGAGEGWGRSKFGTVDAVAPLCGWPFTLFGGSDWMQIISSVEDNPPAMDPVFWQPWWAPWIKMCTSLVGGVDEAEYVRLSAHAYSAHNQRIRDLVPPQQLLEFNVTQGWQPLCEFLEVPEQDCPSAKGEPFPRVNSRETVVVAYRVLRAIAVAYPLLVLLPAWLGLCCLQKAWRCLRKPEAASDKKAKMQ